MKKAYLIILFLFCVLNVFTQTNQEKYWFYRNRLKYFVYVGDQPGESCVACIRNKGLDGTLRYGQHLYHMGYYIGILATEFRLLLNNNQLEDAGKTLDELEYALKACERLDKCEDKEPWNLPNWSYPPSTASLQLAVCSKYTNLQVFIIYKLQ